jgi:DNA repair protein RadA/Sms
MAKRSSVRYRCAECGAVSLTRVGRCTACGAWGSLVEDLPSREDGVGGEAPAPRPLESARPVERLPSGIPELDRVLGGGFVPGGVVLLGGEPGVGKSTLLLQVCAEAAAAGHRVLYLSGEESAEQLADRARRLGARREGLFLLCAEDLPAALARAEGFDLLVVDSVQALRVPEASGWPGSPLQVRAAAQAAVLWAKAHATPTVLVGHITKQGQIAGPKLLEHMVDVVLLFAGERTSLLRILRAEKNRFGSSEEIGLFEMGERGLAAVTDPTRLFWTEEEGRVAGVAVGIALEGTRPLAAEVQALACATPFAYPRRTGRGIEANRLLLLLAVLERRCGIGARTEDIYANAVGGLDLRDPAADLAVACALASAIRDVPLAPRTCFVGEVGLAGEIRPALRTGSRAREAARLGFERMIAARRGWGERGEEIPEGIRVIPVGSLAEAIGEALSE